MTIAMSARAPRRDPDLLFSKPDVEVLARPDGSRIYRTRRGAPGYARCVGDWLVDWARRAPERDFLCERTSGQPGAPWRRLTYRETLDIVEAVAAWMLQAGLGPERPLAVLSDNSIDHALLSLAGSHMGAPVASISPAYSLISKDHAKLRAIIKTLGPGAIYVSDAAQFAGALAAIADLHDGPVIASAHAQDKAGVTPFSQVLAASDPAAVARAFATIGPDTVAKILFTSGSTGDPKGVINTQRMLTFGQESKVLGWTFLDREPPVTLDWLPWSHTFGANHNFNMILRNGGTLYIDGGKPAPGAIERTLVNIRDVAGTVYFNVPRGYDLLVAEMKKDDSLRDAFFKSLELCFYAGAALPQNIWDDLKALSIAANGKPVIMATGWGSTETAPLASDCHFQAERSGNIGVPAAGVELKLTPNGDKMEIRVRGPNVTPGYWRRPDITRSAFDEEGFYLIGDAVRFADPDDPGKGLYFDGRVAEDFKLTTGTWVNVGALRVKAIEALAPLALDVVVAGHGRAEVGFLVFANLPACRQFAGLPAEADAATTLAHPAVSARLRAGMQALRAAGGGSSSYATRALLMAEPPSVDAGEITDKGYVNQRATLARRAALVEALYAGGDGVVTL